jgi:hypothetical protein
MGYWQGHFSIDGERRDVSRAFGTRDRSWGVRPVGEPQGGAPGLLNAEPGVYWVWSPLNFGDVSTQFGTFEDRDGHATQVSADLVPLYGDPSSIPRPEEPGLVKMSTITHRLQWAPGTRRALAGEFHFVDKRGERYDIEVESTGRVFYTLGVGYNHPEWGHAVWKGEFATAREEWQLAAVKPLEYQFLHTHQVVRATLGERTGMGILESIVIGRHDPSGFKDFFDGAA